MRYNFSDIAKAIGAEICQTPTDETVIDLLIDSRKLSLPEISLFIAIDGPHRKGSDYIGQLYQSGVRKFIINLSYPTDRIQIFPEAGFMRVGDTVMALQQLAAFHRSHFDFPVIGITGSNGKTILKEWLFQLLQPRFNIVRSPKSYNSQIGVPLSVWQMNEHHQLGIFEAGISQTGEMEKLQPVIRPDMGILTYMGEAHAEGFSSQRQKIEEKLKLFAGAKTIIYNADDPSVNESLSKFSQSHPEVKLLSWGHQSDANLQCLQVNKTDITSTITCRYDGKEFEFTIPFVDEASVFNALTVCLALLHLDTSADFIQVQMPWLRPLAMRLEIKPGINQCLVINDSYSADIDSLNIALDFLAQQHQYSHKTVILSDIHQPYSKDEQLYSKVAAILNSRMINHLIAVGPRISAHQHFFQSIPRIDFFNDTQELIQQLPKIDLHHQTILLKGARSFGFEKVSRLLEQKLHDTVLEIDLNALRDNLNIYRRQLKPEVKVMVMVKAFGYGSGSAEVASLLQREGIHMLAVAYADEGVELRRAGIRLPIMVMNVSPVGFDNMIGACLEPEIYSLSILQSFLSYLEEHEIKHYPVHLKLDTGMHRLGFTEEDMLGLLELIEGTDGVMIKSVFTHLVASEDPLQDEFTSLQSQLFESMANRLETQLGYGFTRHVCNSAAIHRHPELHMGMVRLGIGLYGAGELSSLKTVTTLKTTIAQIKHLKAGETVGYGRKGRIEKDSKVATVRIGYADGYPRSLGNGNGKMLVAGKLAPVIGNVCMDMTIIDITGIDTLEGEEVIVFGHQPHVGELAQWAGTIAYEILTNISQRVKRVYFEE